MKIHKGFKFRLYPTEEQTSQLLQHGGNTRFLWNYLWNLNKNIHKETKKYKFFYDMSILLPELKKDKKFLKLSVAQSLQQAGKHLDKAIRHSFKPEIIRERKKRLALAKKPREITKALNYGFPKFKNKSNQKDSFTIPQGFKIFKKFLQIPKIGKIKWKQHRKVEGTPKHITITQNGKHWYCSVTAEVEIQERSKSLDNIIGIDVGLTTFATFSDGITEKRHRFIKKYQKKLTREQRWLSRKQKGSSNKQKQRIKVQSVHRKIRNTRNDLHHQISSHMIAKYSGFILEDLNITSMMQDKEKKLAKDISDVGWSNFIRILEYKSLWNSKYFHKIGRWEATSKTCYKCGWYNSDLTLKDRVFSCRYCGSKMNRDLNASINIRDLGLSTLGTRESNAFGEDKVHFSSIKKKKVVLNELGKKIVNNNLLEAPLL